MRNWLIVAGALALTGLVGGCSSAPQETEQPAAVESPCEIGALAADFQVRNVYGDHMVLQTGKPIRICGTAKPGEGVIVKIADKITYACSDMQSEWFASLPAMEPGGPYEVTVEGKDGKKIVFKDVLIGEVWICSGQSNMELPLWGSNRYYRSLEGNKEAAQADFSRIRLFRTPRSTAPFGPNGELKGGKWGACSPSTVSSFSAVGYYFAKQLQKDLNVPIGMIGCYWGGSPIEAWISTGAYLRANRMGELSKIEQLCQGGKGAGLQRLESLHEKTRVNYNAWEQRFFENGATGTLAAADWKSPEFDDADWKNCQLPPGAGVENEIDGVVWYRHWVDIPENWAGKTLKLELGIVDDADETFFNGVKIGATGSDTPRCWSVRRNYSIPAALVKPGKALIAVRLIDFYGAGGFFAVPETMRLVPAEGGEGIVLGNTTWKYKVEFSADLKKIGSRPMLPESIGEPGVPSTLYNGMLAPWTQFPIRGAIWYQGEANAADPENYMVLQPLLIEDWRRLWNDPEMPFVFVQLAAFAGARPSNPLPDDFWTKRAPQDGGWPLLREVQTATLKVPNTGMAVTIDIGAHSDIHPQNKADVGFRLAKEAERICYGNKEITSGPMFESMSVKDGKAILRFSNLGSGLVARGGDPASFAIAGADGKFVWAKAAIVGNTVEVWSEKVKEPQAVRYAWAGYPGNANLYNKEGFPMCPFRTDKADYLLTTSEP